jgi:hypothetical protein
MTVTPDQSELYGGLLQKMTMTAGDPPGPSHTANAADQSNGPDAVIGIAESKNHSGQAWRLLLGALVGAIGAAIGAWVLGELGVTRVAPANDAVPTMGVIISAPTAATTQAATLKSAARLFGACGALLGMALGLSGGWARGSANAALRAAVLGAIAGGVTGIIGPLVVVRAYFRSSGGGGSDELIPSILMHSGLWISIGAAAGIALAIGLGDRRRLARAIAGGVVGSVVGAVVYDLLGAVVFPLAETGEPLAATSSARLLELLVPAIAIAGLAALGAHPPHAKADDNHRPIT